MTDTTPVSATFTALQIGSPVERLVLQFDVAADDQVTATIASGAPDFAISRVEACNLVATPGGASRVASAPVVSVKGGQPLTVKAGQRVQLWIMASLPKDVVPTGKFAGVAELKGKTVSRSVTLAATAAGELIGKILVEPQTVAPGEPVFVQVCGIDGKPLADPSVTVTMQGVPATARYYQFAAAGKPSLVINASRGRLTETATVAINVAGAPRSFRTSLGAAAATAMPYLNARQVLGQPYAVSFTLGTPAFHRRALAKSAAAANTTGVPAPRAVAPAAAAEPLAEEVSKALAALPPEQVVHDAPPPLRTAMGMANHSAVLGPIGQIQAKPEATSYRWDFGDGQTLVTQSPSATHDYFHAIEASKVAHSFHVTCTAVHDNITARRTLVLHSAYGLCRQRGVAVPHVIGDQRATFRNGSFTGSLAVHNPETVPLVIDRVAYVPLSDSPTAQLPTPRFSNLANPVTVAGRGAASLTASVVVKQLQAAAPGAAISAIAVHYSGELRTSGAAPVPVRFSHSFRVPLGAAGPPSVSNPRPRPMQAVAFDPVNAPPVAEGQPCYPDAISDADFAKASAEHLVCQLTGKTTNVEIPSAFQNAQQGDVILSPAPVGDGDMIAAMFAALNPPQHHGHSGIMTLNFYEITHCTASVDRITNNTNKDSLGIPTSLNGAMLQYGWPGSLTQSIDDATQSVSLKDPSGVSYSFQSFNTDSRGDGFELIPPLVVKPLPENETAVRPVLRKAGETARSKGARYDANGNLTQKGGAYYSFYCYTKPEIAAGFGGAGGADAGWAQGHSPAVCSSFVWLCMKENNIPLVSSQKFEQLADFTPLSVQAGAAVGPATLDGLTYYTQANRQSGAQALYQGVLNQALSQEDGLGTIPGVNPTVAGPIADQLLNTFAFGNPNMVGSSAWQNPGDGNAVSPDNIQFWNPPYFGYAEPLQYLPNHSEQYTSSVWTKVTVRGTIKGKVLLNGQPVPQAEVWVLKPGGDTMSAADGSYVLENIPAGSYALQARKEITKDGNSVEYQNDQAGLQGDKITITAGGTLVKDIALGAPPSNFRRLDITYSVSCDHGDGNPFNAHGVEKVGPYQRSAFVNPGREHDSVGYNFDYHNGGYFQVDYNFAFQLKPDGSVDVTITGTMKDDGSHSVQTTYAVPKFTVPRDGTHGGSFSMEHSGGGYHNGPAIYTFHIANRQQTG